MQLSQDIVLSMNHGKPNESMDSYSRNKDIKMLNHHDSTRERLDQQASVPSMNQFTFSNNVVNLNPDSKGKI